jgi:hypothetical protein
MAHRPLIGESEQTNIPGVTAVNANGYALVAESTNSFGIVSRSRGAGVGVYGESRGHNGVRGISYSPQAGVFARNENKTPQAGPGLYAESAAAGVWGKSTTWIGVYGETDSTTGGAAVVGKANNGTAGVAGESPNGVGVFGKGRVAGRFEGTVEVEGDINVTGGHDIRLANADGAEDFDIAGEQAVDPGTVMILGDEGSLCASHQAYDKRVAGIVSGAGDYQPALVLDRQEDSTNRQPIALFGKVFCKVDAQYGAVEIGDLLTTSATPGHAMKASDAMQAFGAVIGKALRPLSGGEGLIPVLVSLQ